MAFSIRQFLFAIALVALGLVGLLNADVPILAEFTNLLTLVILILAGYSIWITEGEQRVFRCGFLGWATVYFVATKWWSIILIMGTPQILVLAAESLLPARIANLRGTGEPFSKAYSEWLNRFETIGHCLITLLFGLIGGWVTVYFYRKRQQRFHPKP